MNSPKIAIISFPGTNGDIENLHCLRRNGFDPFVFRWNADREALHDVDGYFIGAGFSYEDRGRSGMVAGRDPLFQLLHEEAAKGKVVVGHCNGCQVLVESGLIPMGDTLRMCMGHNVVKDSASDFKAVGFLNQWVWIKRGCARDRCCGSDFAEPMHIPIAHGEGRFVTKDPDLIAELEKNDQIAFRYCDASGFVSSDVPVTPNGSTDAIAGLCNPAGNVVAMMPHPERTTNGDPYFQSIRRWMETRHNNPITLDPRARTESSQPASPLPVLPSMDVEIFIDTIIVNNEERTIEKAARTVAPTLKLKQYRYLAPSSGSAEAILQIISLFNPNKELAYVRREGSWYRWDADAKSFLASESPLPPLSLLRQDEPDTGAVRLGKGSRTGVCYACTGVTKEDLQGTELLHIFGNPHASSLSVFAAS